MVSDCVIRAACCVMRKVQGVGVDNGETSGSCNDLLANLPNQATICAKIAMSIRAMQSFPPCHCINYHHASRITHHVLRITNYIYLYSGVKRYADGTAHSQFCDY